MFNQLLPQRVDNTYRGYKLTLWLFGVVAFVKLAQSLFLIFNPLLHRDFRRQDPP